MVPQSVLALWCVVLCARHVVHGSMFRWKTLDQKVDEVSVGPAGVWGTTSKDWVHLRNNSYKTKGQDPGRYSWDWVGNPNMLKVDVGTDIVFGITSAPDGQAHYRTGISKDNPKGNSWVKIASEDKLNDIAISPNGNLWAKGTSGRLWYRKGRSATNLNGTSWEWAKGVKAMSVSAGEKGLWVTNDFNSVYYRVGTYGDPAATMGTRYQHVGGKEMQYVSVGSEVIGLDLYLMPWQRTGITADKPTGSAWEDLKTSGLPLTTSIDTYRAALWTTDYSSTARICSFPVVEKHRALSSL